MLVYRYNGMLGFSFIVSDSCTIPFVQLLSFLFSFDFLCTATQFVLFATKYNCHLHSSECQFLLSNFFQTYTRNSITYQEIISKKEGRLSLWPNLGYFAFQYTTNNQDTLYTKSKRSLFLKNDIWEARLIKK